MEEVEQTVTPGSHSLPTRSSRVNGWIRINGRHLVGVAMGFMIIALIFAGTLDRMLVSSDSLRAYANQNNLVFIAPFGAVGLATAFLLVSTVIALRVKWVWGVLGLLLVLASAYWVLGSVGTAEKINYDYLILGLAIVAILAVLHPEPAQLQPRDLYELRALKEEIGKLHDAAAGSLSNDEAVVKAIGSSIAKLTKAIDGLRADSKARSADFSRALKDLRGRVEALSTPAPPTSRRPRNT